jgi:hypothetical protein
MPTIVTSHRRTDGTVEFVSGSDLMRLAAAVPWTWLPHLFGMPDPAWPKALAISGFAAPLSRGPAYGQR